MKKPILLLIFLLPIFVYGAPIITAVSNNGNYNTTSTWDLNRLPQTGDTVVIPVGKTVLLSVNQSIPGFLYLKIYGVLRLSNGILDLGNSAIIMVYAGGSITSTGCSCEQIRIGNVKKFQGDPIILGPQYASSSTNDFDPILVVLPVKFVSFSLLYSDPNVLVHWSTSEEVNASHFIVERSYNGAEWTPITTIDAKGDSNELIHYSYTDKNITANVVYYRIKEIDTNGRVTYTAIQTVKTKNSNIPVQIIAVQQQILLQFKTAIKGDIQVQLISLSGQVVEQSILHNPTGLMVVSVRTKGHCIVSLSNNQSLQVSKQIIL